MPTPSGRQGSEHGVTNGVTKACQCRVKAVPLVIHRQIYVPVGKNRVFVGCRDVYLVLPELVIDIHQRGIRIEVMQIITRIFGVDHQLIAVGQTSLECALNKKVAIPLLLGMFPHIINYSARNALAAVIKIGFGVPLATAHYAEEGTLDTPGTHLAIATDGCGIPCQCTITIMLAVAEMVLSCGISEFTVE